jgi:hypothetical protein
MRTGLNLAWPDEGGRCWKKNLDGGAYHTLYAIDNYPGQVDRTIYPGSTPTQLWRINLLPFIEEACAEYCPYLDINSLYVKKIGVSLENAWNIIGDPRFGPTSISCDLHRLRLGYTRISSSSTLWRPWGSVPGDATADLHVDIYDALAIAAIWGSYAGDLNYNFSRDLNLDGEIDIYDALILSANYDSSVASRSFQGYGAVLRFATVIQGIAWAQVVIQRRTSGLIDFKASVAYTLELC